MCAVSRCSCVLLLLVHSCHELLSRAYFDCAKDLGRRIGCGLKSCWIPCHVFPYETDTVQQYLCRFAEIGRERCLRINWTIDTTCNPNLGNTDSDICTVRKDANEMLIQDGVAAVQHCVNNPQPLLAEGPYR